MRMPFVFFSQRSIHTTFLLAACASVVFAWNVAAVAAPVTKIVAVTGTTAPGGNGVIASLVQSQTLFLNGSGQVAFTASLTGTAGGEADNFGLYRGDGTSLSQIARQGQTAPGGTGTFVSSMSLGGLNEAGQVAFRSNLPGGGIGGTVFTGLFTGDGTSLQSIARTGQTVPGGNGVFATLSPVTGLNGLGQVAFYAQLATTSGGTNDDTAVFLGNGTVLNQIAREGQPSPDGNGMLQNMFVGGSAVQGVNDLGRVAFGVGQSTSGINSQLLLSDGAQVNQVNQIARGGQPVPGGNGAFSQFAAFDSSGMPASVNASGHVVFPASLSGTTGGGTDDTGIFLSAGGSLSQIAREGQAAPNGNGRFSLFRDVSRLTDSGRVAFVGELADTTGGSSDNSGIFRADGAALVQIARKGQAAPDGSGGFITFMRDPDLSEAGHVVFQASTPLNQGIYLSDDSLGLIKVARTGDPLLGSSIANILATPNIGRGGTTNSIARVSLDQNGQPIVAYGFRLADGRTGIALWSLVPEPGSLAIVAVGAIAIALVTGWPPRSIRRASR
jgi:hypothetical protein